MKNKLKDLSDSYLGLRVSDGAGAFISGFVFLYIFQIIIIAISAILKVDLKNMPYWFTYIMMIVNQASLICAVLAYGKVAGKPMLKTCRINRSLSLKQALLLPIITIVCIMAFLPIAEGFIYLFSLITKETPSVGISIGESWWQILLSILFVGLLPSIGEEILFRGCVARGLKRKSYVFAIIMSGLLFSIFHGNAAQTIHQFLIGMVFCYVYFVSGSLLSSMILHFCNNAIAIILEIILKPYLVNVNPTTVIIVYVVMSIVGFIALYFLLRLFMSITKKERNIIEVDKEKNAWAKDFIRAFTINGIKENYNKLESSLKMLYNDPDDNVDIDGDIKLDNSEDIDGNLKVMLEASNKQMLAKRKRNDRIALGVAIGLAGLVWVINSFLI